MTKTPKHSKDSIRRFVRFMLSLEAPTLMFHQTLTFSPPEFDAKAAKIQLNRLLGNRFIKGAIYSEENHASDGIHYHVLLFFYEKDGLPFPRSKMRDEVRAAVFAAWNSYNGGRSTQRANQLKERQFNHASIEYLGKQAKYRSTRPTNWWGKRNARFLVKCQVPPTKEKVAKAMRQLFFQRPPFTPLGLRCSMRALQREKRDYLEACIGNPIEEWEQAKRKETGRRDSVSDEDLLAFRKSRAASWRNKQRLEHTESQD